MKKAVYITLALVLALSLASCGASDADRSDNTKDGVIGDGLDDAGNAVGDIMDDAGDAIRDGVNDITGNGDRNTGTGSATNGATGGTGTNGTTGTDGGTGTNGTTGTNGGTGTNRTTGTNGTNTPSARSSTGMGGGYGMSR